MPTVLDGIIVGAAGGSIAGITVYLIRFLHEKISDSCESKRIYKWLKENSSDKAGEQFRSTRTISSWTNLTENRVRYLCSHHEKIFLSTGEKEDLWGLYDHTPRSVYEERGMISV